MGLPFFRSVLALSVCFLIAAGSAWGQTSPNIIFILTDDQGLDAIEAPLGSNELNVHTPTLKKLASQGAAFPYARMNPVCSPTRASILTGRHAFRTGVTFVISEYGPLPDRDLVSLQTNERTFAEMLGDMGYYTVHIDKWHVGWDESKGLTALTQGFDASYLRGDYLDLDEPNVVGDEHISLMVDSAVEAITGSSSSGEQPYLLYFASYDPHRRNQDDADGMAWWKVDPALHPSGDDYYTVPNLVDRYRGVVEAVDTEIGRLLRELGVIDANGDYIEESNTVVFFTSDNGTDREVSVFREKAKGMLFEGGLRVPLFVFGAGVPARGMVLGRPVNHVDFYDTIADIVGADDAQRGSNPRNSQSFSDAIGWGGPSPVNRAFTISSKAEEDPADHWVGFADMQYKLIAKAGDRGLALLSEDQFYDLYADPLEEYDLVANGMDVQQAIDYVNMRNNLVNYWPTSVSEAWSPDDWSAPAVHETEQYRLVVWVNANGPTDPINDEFYDLQHDPDALDNLLESGMNPVQQSAYEEMRASITNDLQNPEGSGNVPYLVDIPITQSLVLDSNGNKVIGPLRIGHNDVGRQQHVETRAFLKFDVSKIDEQLPPGMTIDDVTEAQIVVAWKKDSTAADETDTGPIRAYPMSVFWNAKTRDWDKLNNGYLNIELGMVDVAPHVIVNPDGPRMHGLPMPSGTPVSYGYSQDLVTYLKHWYNNPQENVGVVLMADPLALDGNQQVDFLRTGGLRLTLRNQ
ncbi:MAG: DNRLRE domain-containing protein [Planctomycetes bacterium]|nr:DNRLRE domain-containing protein [Planctomycetota bacterium]NOG55918.1 sulfatase-like hydrolase/transferase [Planctomycetota bacterium]